MDENVERMIKEFGGEVKRKEQEEKGISKKELQTLINAKSKKEKTGNKRFIEKALNEKLIKSPTYKTPSYSSEKLLNKLSGERRVLVREVEVPEVVEDRRSLFFKSEFTKESKVNSNWLLK